MLRGTATEYIDERERSRIWADAKAFADQSGDVSFQHRLAIRSGESPSAETGVSLEFAEHRLYSPGDDPRHVNWNAFARSGELFIKVFQKETSPSFELILDCSRSMSLYRQKLVSTLEALCFFFELGRNLGAPVALNTLYGAFDPLPIQEDEFDKRLFEEVCFIEDESPKSYLVPNSRASLRVLVSDLLTEQSPETFIAELTRKDSVLLVVQPTARIEAEPDWDGPHSFRDCENLSLADARLDVGPTFIEEYKRNYARHFELWDEYLLRIGAFRICIPDHLALTSLVDSLDKLFSRFRA